MVKAMTVWGMFGELYGSVLELLPDGYLEMRSLGGSLPAIELVWRNVRGEGMSRVEVNVAQIGTMSQLSDVVEEIAKDWGIV